MIRTVPNNRYQHDDVKNTIQKLLSVCCHYFTKNAWLKLMEEGTFPKIEKLQVQRVKRAVTATCSSR